MPCATLGLSERQEKWNFQGHRVLHFEVEHIVILLNDFYFLFFGDRCVKKYFFCFIFLISLRF